MRLAGRSPLGFEHGLRRLEGGEGAVRLPSVEVRVAGPTRIEPGLANDWIAAASLTTVPTGLYSNFVPAPIGQRTAGPVSMPIPRGQLVAARVSCAR